MLKRLLKELIIVPGTGHVDVLRSQVWVQIERWLAQSAA
jgi:hypothetical protein